MTVGSFLISARLLSVLLKDDAEYLAQSAYLFSLYSHTEAYQEQAAWCWLHAYKEKLYG